MASTNENTSRLWKPLDETGAQPVVMKVGLRGARQRSRELGRSDGKMITDEIEGHYIGMAKKHAYRPRPIIDTGWRRLTTTSNDRDKDRQAGELHPAQYIHQRRSRHRPPSQPVSLWSRCLISHRFRHDDVGMFQLLSASPAKWAVAVSTNQTGTRSGVDRLEIGDHVCPGRADERPRRVQSSQGVFEAVTHLHLSGCANATTNELGSAHLKRD